jgi:aminoglycoside 3-N-acetyltransferase I
MSSEDALVVRRLGPGDEAIAARVLLAIAEVFEEPREALPDAYVRDLLARADFWLIAAIEDGEPRGGLTAHTLPMTRTASREVFLYDIAVTEGAQRRGVGRRLVATLRDLARAEGIKVVFVPAGDEDTRAVEFYRALGGEEEQVKIFTFGE